EELERLARSDGWVRALAQRLVGDAALADDVVQEAYLVALSKPARPRGSLTAWLSGVVRNLASSRLRDEARRCHRERQAARPERVGATDDHVARLEQQDLLIRSLLSCVEPYREALILRHVEGLAPRHIAERLGLPIATVNSRLARGLEQLRERLDAAHGGDRDQWLAGFAPLLLPTSKVQPILLGGLLVKHKLTALAATLALLFFAGYQLLFGGTPEAEQPGIDLAGAGPSLAADQPASDPGPPAAIERRSVAAAGTPSATVAPPVSAAGGASLEVLLLDARTDKPMAGADVFASDFMDFPISGFEAEEMKAHMPWSVRELLRAKGTRYTTDERGIAVVEAGAVGLMLLGEAGELSCLDAAGMGDERVELRLASDRPVRVRVRGATGQLASGVPVKLAAEASRGGSNSFLVSVSTGITDAATGIAELVLPAHGAQMADTMPLVVALGYPMDIPVTAPVFIDRLPSEPIELVLPSTGEVEVRVERGGIPAPDGTLVRLGEAGGAGSSLFEGSMVFGATENGVVRLGPVGLGGMLRVEAAAPGLVHAEGLDFEAPTLHGQLVHVELSLEREARVLAGSLLDWDDSVPDGSMVNVQVGSVGGMLGDLGEDGSFELSFGLGPEDTELVLTQYGPDTRSITVSLPPASGGRIELGELRLPRPEPVDLRESDLAGHVLDAAGEPVAHALVELVRRRADGLLWSSVGATMGASQVDGSFELPDLPDEPGLFLQVRSGAGWHEPVPVSAPSHDLVLRLEPGADLVGRLELDPGVSPRALWLGVWDAAQGPAPERMDVHGWTEIVLERDSFRFQGLRPGSYTLRVEPKGDAAAGGVVPGVVVAALESTDGRLDPLDLRGAFRSLDLQVVNSDGQRLSASIYTLRGSHLEHIGSSDRGGFLVGHAPLDAILVEADGYFPRQLDPGNLPELVVLERGFRVPIRWASGTALEDLNFSVQVELTPVGVAAPKGPLAYYLRRWGPRVGILGQDEPHVPAPGTYELRVNSLVVGVHGTEWSRELSFRGASELTIDEATAPIELVIDAATLEAEAEHYRELGSVRGDL
ncbi:MAG: sigma-70 family RNA polymerase sigma factor, partial [Planctomycetota bacterium]|nr:sigma-70 family RNA polymerase sigma factor [Planctomycetota bacterium]